MIISQLTLQLVYFLSGIALLSGSGSYCVDATSALAKRFKLSATSSGSLLLGFATTLPEIMVTLIASIRGNIELSIGNALGSYMCNIGFVLALCALIKPIMIDKKILSFEIPFMCVCLVIAIVLVMHGSLGSLDAALLLLLLAGYVAYQCMQEENTDQNTPSSSSPPMPETWLQKSPLILLWTVLSMSLVALTLSSHLIIASAKTMATLIGIPDLIIGLTAVALGTSLPELATCVAALLKGNHGMAIGNIIGSNIYCLLLILSIPILFSNDPISTETLWPSFITMITLTLILWVVCAKFDESPRINRWEGGGLLGFYGVYYAYLTIQYTPIAHVIS